MSIHMYLYNLAIYVAKASMRCIYSSYTTYNEIAIVTLHNVVILLF